MPCRRARRRVRTRSLRTQGRATTSRYVGTCSLRALHCGISFFGLGRLGRVALAFLGLRADLGDLALLVDIRLDAELIRDARERDDVLVLDLFLLAALQDHG